MAQLKERTRRKKLQRLERSQGIPAYVPSLGARRRIQALATIGWSRDDLYLKLNPGATVVQGSWVRSENIHLRHHRAIADLYRRLIDTTGPSPQAKLVARRNCWGGPMDWADIDDPHEVAHCCIERAHVEALSLHKAWLKERRTA